ncbi:Mitochondrial uncoupling protein 1 [Camellia lanceoleosa]|nr:Mitochondrial uncoupling protein 1 [Camellia lanceoleosa]
MCTIPFDTAKLRRQLQKKAIIGDAMTLPKYKGMLGIVATIAREEGLASRWKGIVPELHRQWLFRGLRIGLYEPLRFISFSYVGKNYLCAFVLVKALVVFYSYAGTNCNNIFWLCLLLDFGLE